MRIYQQTYCDCPQPSAIYPTDTLATDLRIQYSNLNENDVFLPNLKTGNEIKQIGRSIDRDSSFPFSIPLFRTLIGT